VRLRRTSGLAATASEGVAARVAPASTSSSARLAVRFQTVTGWPAARYARTIAWPIGPRPIIVTGVLMTCSFG
jgi:hypothetical protein